MKKFVIGLMFLGLASQGFAQEEDLEGWFEGTLLTGITVTPVINGEYLDKVQEGVFSPLVLNLEEEVARYDVTESPIYNETAKIYKIVFRRPNARILATFDNEGTLKHSFEKFKDIACPEKVRNTLYDEFSGWQMKGNTYFVYYDENGELRRVYKIELENGPDRQSIKLCPEGTKLDADQSTVPAQLEKS
jgi:hypothetical protein